MKVKASHKLSRLTSSSQAQKVFSPIDNKLEKRHSYKQLKCIQSVREPSKENNHVFVSYDTLPLSTSNTRPIQVIPYTFNAKAEPTTKRPTMGGKTIGAIQQSSTIMSCEELKLLSRRIDPHQPLASPHASPTKPPLPNLKKRTKSHLHKETEKKKKRRLFECTPCHTVYKTRAKWTHHTNICPHHKKRHSLSVTVQCVCGSEGDGNMIECTQCHTWLHVKCAGDRVTKEDCYCCPRCSTDETEPVNDSEDELLVEDEDMISLSALYSAKERGKNLLESLKQVQEKDAQQEQERMNRNHLNFMSLFDEPQLEIQDQEEEFQSLSLPPSSIFEDQEWNVHEFDWCQPEDVPSLLFSSDDTPSNIDEVPFSPIQQQPDWFDFANFEVDFTSDI